MATPAPQRRGWLFGPGPDLLLGCGLGYVLFQGAQLASAGAVGSAVPVGAVILATSLPHYGATLVRVYESPEDRRRYSLLAVHGMLALALAFVVGVHSALVGSLLITVYLTWSPWHYTGQNYGIFLMMLGRRGVAITPRTKRLVHLSFVSSFLLTALAIHSVDPSASYAPVSYEGTAYRLLPLGIPASVAEMGLIGLGAVYLLSLGAAAVLLLRRGGLAAVLPSLLLAGTQALWFTIPVVVRHWNLHGGSEAVSSLYTAQGFLWIASAHAVQYLWVTTYYAQRSPSFPGRVPYLAKTALAGFAVWTLPALLFAPGALGNLPYDAGLALQVAAVVNLHHFVLDGAIWKLREGRVARVLLRSSEAPATAGGEEGRAAGGGGRWRAWVPRAVWAAGALAVALTLAATYEGSIAFGGALERGDLSRAQTAAERLAWMGRDSASRRVTLARHFAQAGRYGAARRELQHSLELHPTADAWRTLAQVHQQGRRWREAARAYEEALSLAPEHVATLHGAARAWLELERPERAVPLLERAAALAPDRGALGLTLERARDALESQAGGEAGPEEAPDSEGPELSSR